MYISIDMGALRFLHKHPNLDVISNLDFILAKHEDTNLGSLTDYNLFSHYDDKEMATLYSNMVGTPPSFVGITLRMALFELAESFPVTDCDEAEVLQQVRYVERWNKDSDPGYFYVKGAAIPGKTAPPVFHMEFTPEHARNAARRVPPRAVAQAAAQTHSPTAPRAPTAVKAPRSGGVREIIWRVADEMWAAVGSPKDSPTVRKLRIKMMDALEAQDVKRTTSSNELGNWQKNRCG